MQNSLYLKAEMKSAIVSRWFDELQLYAAPSCNMLCNFCSKGSDCLCNGNNPLYASKVMTPRQAVNWALGVALKDKRKRVVKITGPGEPLCNVQTFEVFKRLRKSETDLVFAVSTNGLLLAEKAEELAALGVRLVDVSINALKPDSVKKLYSKLVLDGRVVADSEELSIILYERQIEGLRKCRELGIEVTINSIVFAGINDDQLEDIAILGKKHGVEAMNVIVSHTSGKLSGMMVPSMSSLAGLQFRLGRIIPRVQLKSFIT